MYFRTFSLRNISPDEPTDFGELSSSLSLRAEGSRAGPWGWFDSFLQCSRVLPKL